MYAIILATSVLLGGCNASGDNHQPVQNGSGIQDFQPAQAPPSIPTADDHRPLLICFGDSLTAGYGAETGKSYPDFLQADLDAKGFRYRVVNKGISGATTKDGVAQLPSIVVLKPAVVVVEFGGNDGLRGLSVRDMRANFDTIIATLQASGAKVVLAGITLPPDYGPDYISQFTETYPLLAKKYKLPLVPFLLQNVFGVPGMMQQDQTHATAKGNEIVARNVLPLVLPLLKK
ncbi:MAG: arylesterase [Granulicella sp.]